MVDALTYYVDLMNWLLEGTRVKEVFARGQKGVLKDAGFDTEDVSYAILTYADGAVVNLGIAYSLPDQYPARGHAARVEVLGTGGVMILDDDHTDQIMYSEKGVPHVYLPDQPVNMVFLQSGTPGRLGAGGLLGAGCERDARLARSSRGRQAVRAGHRPRGARHARGHACDRALCSQWQAGGVATCWVTRYR